MNEAANVATSPVGQRAAGVLEFVVKLVAIGVPVLYALGRIYSDSYWLQLGLTSSLMDDSAEDYIYMGFLSLVVAGARLLGVDAYSTVGYAALVALVVALLTVVAAIVDRWLNKVIRARAAVVRERVSAWKASRHGALVRHGLLGAAMGTGTLFFVMVGMTVFSLVILPLVFAVSAGKRQAIADHNRLSASLRSKDRPPPMAHYSAGGKRQSAPLLACSEHWCIVLINGEFAAIPHATVEHVDQTEPAAAQPAGVRTMAP